MLIYKKGTLRNKHIISKKYIAHYAIRVYKDDINKAPKRYNSKVSAILDNIPGYLSTHEKKVVLNKIDEKGCCKKLVKA